MVKGNSLCTTEAIGSANLFRLNASSAMARFLYEKPSQFGLSIFIGTLGVKKLRELSLWVESFATLAFPEQKSYSIYVYKAVLEKYIPLG